jgi:hypothetical protein
LNCKDVPLLHLWTKSNPIVIKVVVAFYVNDNNEVDLISLDKLLVDERQLRFSILSSPDNSTTSLKKVKNWVQMNMIYQCFLAAQRLNNDLRNSKAEARAMGECTLGLEVKRTWYENEMVCHLGGRVMPGTPDGAWESGDGTLTCVQVVRVPIVAEFTEEKLCTTLITTISRKTYKSKVWLDVSNFDPEDFIIFCWLPFEIPESVVRRAEQTVNPRFTLKMRVPPKKDDVFPKLFALHQKTASRRRRPVRVQAQRDSPHFSVR